MTQVINAFHPDYAKTYHPELFASLRQESRQTQAGKTLTNYVEKKRETCPSHGTIEGISKKIIPSHINRPKQMMVRRTRSQIMADVAEKAKAKDVNWGTVLKDSPNIPKNRPEMKKGK